MGPRRLLALSAEAALLVVVLSLVVGQIAGQPILLSFVETGSMEPTIETGDGFIAVPGAVAGEIDPGEVIVFRAEEVGGGGLTTHRVVDETESGYITQGDANPFPDQDADEPPVKEPQIVAVAAQVGGEVLVIPELGTAVIALRDAATGLQRWLAVTLGTRDLLGSGGIPYLIAGLSAIGYVADLLVNRGDEGRPEYDRDRDRDQGLSVRVVLLGLAALLVLTATAAMAVPAGPQQFGVVSADFDSESPTVIPSGTASTTEYVVPNAGLIPTHVVLEPQGELVSVGDRELTVPGRGEAQTELTLTAPPETGYYRLYLHEHRYLAVLPRSVVMELYAVHPWAPVVAVDALLGIGLYGLGRALVDDGRIRSRNRGRDRPGRSALGRLRRLFR